MPMNVWQTPIVKPEKKYFFFFFNSQQFCSKEYRTLQISFRLGNEEEKGTNPLNRTEPNQTKSIEFTVGKSI